MSILGINNAKFVYDDIEVDLPFSMFEPTFIQSDEVINKSIINGTKNFIERGDYSHFDVTIYLFKYENPAEKLLEILSYKNQLVYFYPYSDGDCLKDKTGNDILTYISSVEIFPLLSKNSDDICIIRFKPSKYVKYIASNSQGYGHSYGHNYGHS